jgi:adenylate cyclase
MTEVSPTGNAASLISWLHQQGLRGVNAGTILEGLCERLVAAGLDIQRAIVGGFIFHPQVEARTFTWTASTRKAEWHTFQQEEVVQHVLHAPTTLSYLHTTGTEEFRLRLDQPGVPLPFALLERLQGLGFTDYIALFQPFGTAADPAIWPNLPKGMTMYEGITCVFGTTRPGGFSESELALLRSLAPPLAVAVKVATVLEMSETLLSTYLGPATGRSVLRGQVRRGQGRVINAVVWHSDLRDSTALAERTPLESYLATLNTYYDCVVGAVTNLGGEVLKFIGDGVLAMFPFEADTQAGSEASEKAIAAARDALARLSRVNAERAGAGLTQIRCGIALHTGNVMYGNVGSTERLDFTVMGAAVNETTRLESLCKTLDVPLVISEGVAVLYAKPLRSIGRHTLRGVGRPMQVFSLSDLVAEQPQWRA